MGAPLETDQRGGIEKESLPQLLLVSVGLTQKQTCSECSCKCNTCCIRNGGHTHESPALSNSLNRALATLEPHSNILHLHNHPAVFQMEGLRLSMA